MISNFLYFLFLGVKDQRKKYSHEGAVRSIKSSAAALAADNFSVHAS